MILGAMDPEDFRRCGTGNTVRIARTLEIAAICAPRLNGVEKRLTQRREDAKKKSQY
jgi:hypothetical protein